METKLWELKNVEQITENNQEIKNSKIRKRKISQHFGYAWLLTAQNTSHNTKMKDQFKNRQSINNQSVRQHIRAQLHG